MREGAEHRKVSPRPVSVLCRAGVEGARVRPQARERERAEEGGWSMASGAAPSSLSSSSHSSQSHPRARHPHAPGFGAQLPGPESLPPAPPFPFPVARRVSRPWAALHFRVKTHQKKEHERRPVCHPAPGRWGDPAAAAGPARQPDRQGKSGVCVWGGGVMRASGREPRALGPRFALAGALVFAARSLSCRSAGGLTTARTAQPRGTIQAGVSGLHARSGLEGRRPTRAYQFGRPDRRRRAPLGAAHAAPALSLASPPAPPPPTQRVATSAHHAENSSGLILPPKYCEHIYKTARRPTRTIKVSKKAGRSCRSPAGARAPLPATQFRPPARSLSPPHPRPPRPTPTQIGKLEVGSEHPVRLQTMTTTGA